ncbi:monocarboxylate transporter 14 [Trichonephila inaurata madagascariensis]|uniref:Monocarboxylate transporter 14 n=1 Tax=Trichonephila inaurata madagascariensis TaxID=2747483 RepID=A0A8X6YI31_9ARAC|nr:monocarboxylate transporter 14 [Trichonephila inaurata madagascariensis]
MASAINKSRENVDFNDSNINGTLYKVEASNIKSNGKEKPNHQFSTPSVSSSSSSSDDSEATIMPLPPDGGWGWVVVFAAFMINFIADGISFSFGILFIDFVDYFGASKAKTSWVGSIFFSMPLLAGPVASYLIDRYGCQRMCILGALLSTVSFAVSALADSLEMLFLTYTIAGLGLAFCYVTSIVIVAYYFEKKRSLATGLAACGTGIGTFVLPVLTSILAEEYSWQGTLLILSGFLLNMVVFGALMRDLESPTLDEDNTSEGKPNNALGIGVLENSERLCSSMVQLPTYLQENCPEVISELSSKEGTHLSSLLEQHPYLLDAIIKKDPDGSVESSSVTPHGEKEKSTKKRKKVHSRSVSKSLPYPDQKGLSIAGKLDAAYLRNLKIQRGSITYRGAMLNIHRYRLKASSCPDIFRNSMVTIPEEKPCLCLHDLKDLMMEMFDFSNFKNVGYTLFCISNFLLYACVDVPYVYIPDLAISSGTDKESASLLISILGVLNCLGVVIVGYIGDKPWIDSSLLYSGFILISGVSLALVPVIVHYYATATLVGIYGFTISANYTLVPIIIVNLISLDNFTGAYGLLLLVQGIASLIGPPAAGALFDYTGNYDITFYCTGLLIILSGALVIPVSNSLRCRKSTPNSSKESVSTADSRKVKFQKPLDSSSVKFLDVNEKKKIPMDKSIFSLNDSAENALPLLSGNEQILHEEKDDKDGSNIMSMYANPLSVA